MQGPSQSPSRMKMSNPRPSEPLQRLREAVEQADYVVGAAVYHEAQSLFTACLSNPQYLRNLQQLAPEYSKPEFLLCVDSAGSPVYSTEEIIEDLRETAGRHPSLGLWFQEATVEEGERPVLLVARWLCHLAGFRHRSVHLFIDHPTRGDYTLVQVRSVDPPGWLCRGGSFFQAPYGRSDSFAARAAPLISGGYWSG